MKSTTLSRPLLLLFCAAPLLFSCKKDKDEATPAERVLGTWNIVKETEKRYDYTTGAFLDSSAVNVPSGAFTAEFRTDGKMYLYKNDGGGIDRDTLGYKFQNDSLLIINDNEFDIRQFTSNHLITRDYYDDGSANIEHLLEFKK